MGMPSAEMATWLCVFMADPPHVNAVLCVSSRSMPLTSHAARQPRLEAGVQRTLEGVGCSRWCGADAAASGPVELAPPFGPGCCSYRRAVTRCDAFGIANP